MLAPPLPLVRPASFLVGLGLLAFAGCSSSSGTTTPVTHPTMIEIAPESFLGSVPCATEGPGLKRYVATLFDTNVSYVTDYSYETTGSGGTTSTASGSSGTSGSSGIPGVTIIDLPDTQLPSSGPTRCLASVGFGYVVSQRRYRVEIDGYDTDDLEPRGVGSRLMVDSAGKLVEPKWKVSCSDPIVAVENLIVRGGRCTETFQSLNPDGNGSLSIKLPALLGALRCGTEAGEVERFEVSLSVDETEGAQPEPQSVPCGADAVAVFEELPAGQLLSAHVAAFSAESSAPVAGANCSARTIADANVWATCEALNQTGTLRVDLPAALELLDETCTGSDLTLEVRAPGDDEPEIVTPPSCQLPLDRGFAPGPAALTITAKRLETGAAVEVGSVTCHGEVTPGQLVRAECEPNRAD